MSRNDPQPDATKVWHINLLFTAVLGFAINAFPAVADDIRPPMAVLKGGTELLLFDAETPGNTTSLPLKGLKDGEIVIAIDAKVSDGRVMAITNHNRTLHIVTTTGDVTETAILAQGFDDERCIFFCTFYNFYVDSRGHFENFMGMKEKWLRSDIMNPAGQPWFYILPNGEVFYFVGFGQPDEFLFRVGKNAYENPELLVNASLTELLPSIVSDAIDTDTDLHFYRSSSGNFFLNLTGLNEKWFKGEQRRKSRFGNNNPWYFILPNGEVFEWDGVLPINSSSTSVGRFGTAAYRKPSLLYNANQVNLIDNLDFSELRDFHFDRSEGLVHNLHEDGVVDVKWFRGADIIDPNTQMLTGNPWYFASTDGSIVKWDGGFTPAGPSGDQVNQFPEDAWDNLEQIIDVYPRLTTPEALAVDHARGLFRASNDSSYYFNAFGGQEKWIRGDPWKKSSKGSNNPWYFILPGGVLMEWDGNPDLMVSGMFVGYFGDQAYEQPNSLCDAYSDGGALTDFLPVSPFSFLASPEGERLNPDELLVDNVTGLPTEGVGCDFNPVTGLLHIVISDETDEIFNRDSGNFIVDRSHRCDVDTGRFERLPDIDSLNGDQQVAGIGFTNNFVDPPVGTEAFLLDVAAPDAFDQFFPITGDSTQRGAIPNSNIFAGMEIIGDGQDNNDTFFRDPGDGDVLAVVTVGGVGRLISIDLNTNTNVDLGQIGTGHSDLSDICIDLMNQVLQEPPPQP